MAENSGQSGPVRTSHGESRPIRANYDQFQPMPMIPAARRTTRRARLEWFVKCS